jgi:hypothetical protein
MGLPRGVYPERSGDSSPPAQNDKRRSAGNDKGKTARNDNTKVNEILEKTKENRKKP